MLTVGSEMVSLAVNERVMMFPTFANVVVELLEVNDTDDKVGAVISNVIPVLVTDVAVFPEGSLPANTKV